MIVRKLSLAAAVSLSLAGMSSVSHALGLGEIEMYSALNQTLDAEIAILSATDSELEEMQVRLASSDAFARAGLEQSPILDTVEFTVDRRPDGQAVVKVTSDSPIFEPFLNFLLEVDAPGSVKLVREYTVLLSPPTFADNGAVGEPIDLSGKTLFEGNDTGAEVSFTETTIGTFIEPNVTTTIADADTENLFLPEDNILTELPADTTTTDSDSDSDSDSAAAIALALETDVTPQTDDIPDAGIVVPLDDLIATNANESDINSGTGGAIFENEFEASQSQLIESDELAGLISDEETFAEQTVTLADTSPVEQPASSVFAADLSSDDTDAEGQAGDLIDLSGVLDGVSVPDSGSNSSAVNSETVTDSASDTDSASNARSIVSNGTGTYRIRTQDTLWSIAKAHKSNDVDNYQMVVALFTANPAAFIDGNMNHMINGAVLQIPAAATQRSVDPENASAIVRSWTRDNRPPASSSSTTFNQTETVVDNNNLDDINERYEEVLSEVETGTEERDALQGRVESLTDNMEEMKSLITVRESELNKLQDEVLAAESNAAALDAQISELSNSTDRVAAEQQNLDNELTEAQNEIARQADAEKNLATAEAEAQAVLLASEEDALRSQLAALELEKRALEASSQLEKAALVREAEEEKTRLLAQAKAEREQISAELEAEKARITRDAENEIARIRGDAETENQRLLSEAQAAREQAAANVAKLEAEQAKAAADAEQLQAKLAAVEAGLEEEKNNARLQAQTALDNGSEEPSRVKDRLAQLQLTDSELSAEEKAAMISAAAEDKAAMVDADTDADGVITGAVDGIKKTGESMAADGTAAVGGLLGAAPLGDLVGNRQTVFAAGAGLSLLGLLGAWAFRRRKAAPAQTQGLRPRGEIRPVAANDTRSRLEQEKVMYGDDDVAGAQPQQRASSAAAAAAAAAAAVTGTAVATSKGNQDADKPLAPAEKAQQAAQPANTQSAEPAATAIDEEEEMALDDTITEAEVYLRYGLHGQAEDLLNTALERSPDNEEYHFKLLENYHDQKNTDKFSQLAETFNGKFPKSRHQARVAEMGKELTGAGSESPQSSASAGTLAAGAAGAAAMATGAIANAKDTASDGMDLLSGGASSDTDLLDQTIDPGSEFSVDELQATGNLGALVDDDADLAGGLSLDDVDLASLDDDGTMNLEEIAGSQMSGGDLGTLDLTNPDTSFDDLSLEDLDASFGDSTADLHKSMDADLTSVTPLPGGTDEMESKLDLAKAYLDMGDKENAGRELQDIAARGNPLQQVEAAELLKKLT